MQTVRLVSYVNISKKIIDLFLPTMRTLPLFTNEKRLVVSTVSFRFVKYLQKNEK